jgi:hypothetical protein
MTPGPGLSALQRPLGALAGRRGRIANLNDSTIGPFRNNRDAGSAQQRQGGLKAYIRPFPLLKFGHEPDADPSAFGELGATEVSVLTGTPEQSAETAR